MAIGLLPDMDVGVGVLKIMLIRDHFQVVRKDKELYELLQRVSCDNRGYGRVCDFQHLLRNSVYSGAFVG